MKLDLSETPKTGFLAMRPIFYIYSVICNLATGEISIFYLVSVAEETSLKLDLSETPKTGFLETRPIFHGANLNLNSVAAV